MKKKTYAIIDAKIAMLRDRAESDLKYAKTKYADNPSLKDLHEVAAREFIEEADRLFSFRDLLAD